MAREHFAGTLPTNLHYDCDHHMWVREEGDVIVVGATAFGLHLAGAVIAFMAKPAGAQVQAGRGLGVVETGKTVLSVHAPCSLVIAQANEAAMERPETLNRAPYGGGWMVRARALDWDAERARLVAAPAYRDHCLSLEPDAQIELESATGNTSETGGGN